MVRQFVDSEDLTTIADALRSKTSVSTTLLFPDDYITLIDNLDDKHYPDRGIEDGYIEGTGKVLISGATYIKERACINNLNLTTVDLSNAISIGRDAFKGCDSLTKLIIRTPTVCELKDSLIFNPGISIYVPDYLVSQYEASLGAGLEHFIHPISELGV